MATMNAPTMDRRTTGERRVSMRPHTRSAMSGLDYLAMALLIIGGLNWGMVGLFDVDMVATLFGPGSPATRVVYVLVGVAALYSVYTTAKMAGSKRGL
ncbi:MULTISPECIES: DUF378 domain-containing protein [unclassified Massilia]|uniref:DUF378 domain-containing protein n=1 Tax=unclassified Massilia TaxID=2609279 RepID=UPI001B827099|nr:MULTISPECIES: DUF378 domain-containing protein [unclassified Massilia]MBQ5940156.1 DUF378 domain-containing protein [Massilia sp. AB1]MBQ5962994.1 DUF378 domain-containing protein [Massilia sp. ZL223]